MTRLLPAVFILIAIGLFFGYVNPTYTGPVAALREDIQSYDSALAAAREFKQKEQELIARRSQILPEDTARVEAFLPDSVDNVQLILDLNALAERSGITLSNFDVATGREEQENDQVMLESESPVSELDLSLSATGSYAAFKSFLLGTELSLRPLDLVELNISDSPTGVYTYEMTYRIYWLR